MAIDQVANFIKVQTLTGYDHTATSITLQAGQGAALPDPATGGAYNMVWWNVTDYADPTDDPYKQIVRVTAKSGDVLTITQGQEGTSAADMNIATKTYQLILTLTKKTIDDLRNSLISTIKTVSTTYPITSADALIIGNTASASFTVTLPSAVTNAGKIFIIKKGATAFVLTVATTSAQTIDGATTAILRTKNETLQVVSDGSNWVIMQSKAGQVQIGQVIPWHGSFTNVPALGEEYVECNGQTLSDTSSPLNGQVIPNINGASAGQPRFIRGSTVSGTLAGSDTHTHTLTGTTDSQGTHQHTYSGTTDPAGSHSHSICASASGCGNISGGYVTGCATMSFCGTTDSENSDTTVDQGNLNNVSVASACHTHTFSGSVSVDGSGFSVGGQVDITGFCFYGSTDTACDHQHTYSGIDDPNGLHSHNVTGTTAAGSTLPAYISMRWTMRIK